MTSLDTLARLALKRARSVSRSHLIFVLVADNAQFATSANRALPAKVQATLLRAWADMLDAPEAPPARTLRVVDSRGLAADGSSVAVSPTAPTEPPPEGA